MRPTRTPLRRRFMPWRIVEGNPLLVHSGLNVTDFIAANMENLSSLDYGNLHGDAIPEKIGELGLKLFTTVPLFIDKTSFTRAYFDEAPRLCHLIANIDFSLRESDDIDYTDVDIGAQDEAELDQTISETITRASKHLFNRLHDSFRSMILNFRELFPIRLGGDT